MGSAFPPVSPFSHHKEGKGCKTGEKWQKKFLSSKWVPSTHFLVEIYNTCHCCKTPQLVFCDTLSLSCCNKIKFMLQIPNICFNSLPPFILFSCMPNIGTRGFTSNNMCRIYFWKDKSYGLVLPNVFIVSYRIAKCIS